MAEIGSIITDGVENVSATDDGKFALLKFKTPDETPAIAIPSDSLMGLMAVLSQCAGNCQKILGSDPSMKHIFPTEWWEVGAHPDGQHVVMSYRIPGGLESSFQIHRDAALAFREALDSVLGNSSAPGREVQRH